MSTHLVIRCNKQCDFAIREARYEEVPFTPLNFLWGAIFTPRKEE